MKVTNKLAKELKDFINVAKRKTNIVEKQMINDKGLMPFIIHMTDKEVGFRFTFSTEEMLTDLLQRDNPKIVAYCLVDSELFEIFEELEYRDIDLDTYIEKTTKHIQNNMITRTDAREIIYQRKQMLKRQASM